jgi:heme-degrading monooxygenase HmoA
MSVTAIIHFPVADVAKAIEGLQANAALLEEITEDTKGAGILHHRFVAGTAELVVIDEWESAEQFQGFVEGNPKVERVTTVIGVTGPPAVTVYNSFEAPGAVKGRSIGLDGDMSASLPGGWD